GRMKDAGCQKGRWQAVRGTLLRVDFGQDPVGFVDGFEGFADAGRVNGDGASDLVGVVERRCERLDVAVENNAHQLVDTIDHGAARVASDNVRRADEVQRRVEIQLVARGEVRVG